MGILVIGSFMMDLVVNTHRVPENGETIIGSKFSRFPGGKGANQAVAASRLGGEVTFVGKVGNDEYGDEAIKVLTNESVNIKYLLRDNQNPTGVGMVTIEDGGNNRIIVVPGANLAYSIIDLIEIDNIIKNADILVLQLEMDISMIEKAVSTAWKYNVPIILNPAPAQYLSENLLKKITYLTPNETELEILTGMKLQTRENVEDAAKILLDKGIDNIILTLAEKGAMIINNSGVKYVPGYQVETIDTVAAGDAFNGALAVAIKNKKSLHDAVQFANAAGALTVTKAGAIPSLPKFKEVGDFLKKDNNMTNV